jgi:hypothetical protein
MSEAAVFVVEFNYGTMQVPDWQPVPFLGKKGPGYNTRMCCGDPVMAANLAESVFGRSDKWRVAVYTRG